MHWKCGVPTGGNVLKFQLDFDWSQSIRCNQINNFTINQQKVILFNRNTHHSIYTKKKNELRGLINKSIVFIDLHIKTILNSAFSEWIYQFCVDIDMLFTKKIYIDILYHSKRNDVVFI